MTIETRTTNVNGIDLVVPAEFGGILPVSPHPTLFEFEPSTFIGLESCMSLGDIAFDVGSSFGVLSTLMAKIVGPTGKIFSFEANLDAIEKSRDLIAANGLESIIELNNYLVGNFPQEEMDFYIIPGFESVASTISPGIAKICPNTVKKRIRTLRIDDFCKSKKIIPKCIKIDTEGAEFVVVDGMKNLIESSFPDLVIETHGHEIEGVGGSLKELANMLESFGYGLFDLKVGKKSDSRTFVLKNFNLNSTLLASKKLNDEKYARRLEEKLQPLIKDMEETQLSKNEGLTIRALAEKGLFEEIINQLRYLPLESKDGLKQYYLALALHATGLDLKEALERYDKALTDGFFPFWVYYNRALLYQKIGDVGKAMDDLIMAERYNKSHPGVQHLRKILVGSDISQNSS